MEPSKGRICTWKLTLTFCTVGKLSSVHTQRWFWSLTGQQTVLWHGFPCGWSKWNGGATNLILILVPCNVVVLQFYMCAFWFFFFKLLCGCVTEKNAHQLGLESTKTLSSGSHTTARDSRRVFNTYSLVLNRLSMCDHGCYVLAGRNSIPVSRGLCCR